MLGEILALGEILGETEGEILGDTEGEIDGDIDADGEIDGETLGELLELSVAPARYATSAHMSMRYGSGVASLPDINLNFNALTLVSEILATVTTADLKNKFVVEPSE